jgi:choline/glycine/proline betaine transport protein
MNSTLLLAVGGLATLVVITFFITSSDSGSLVIDIITSGGRPNPPTAQRVYWASLEGVVAAVLLVGGGLIALQTAAISAGLPFAVLILLMIVSLHRALAAERGG